jgi:hypothetical protein
LLYRTSIEIPGEKVTPDTEGQNNNRENDFGTSFIVGMQPYQREGNGAGAKESNHNRGSGKIPLCFYWVRPVKKFIAIAAFDGRILNFFGTKRARFHECQ